MYLKTLRANYTELKGKIKIQMNEKSLIRNDVVLNYILCLWYFRGSS